MITSEDEVRSWPREKIKRMNRRRFYAARDKKHKEFTGWCFSCDGWRTVSVKTHKCRTCKTSVRERKSTRAKSDSHVTRQKDRVAQLQKKAKYKYAAILHGDGHVTKVFSSPETARRHARESWFKKYGKYTD